MSGALGVQSQLVVRRCVEAVVHCFSNEHYVSSAYQVPPAVQCTAAADGLCFLVCYGTLATDFFRSGSWAPVNLTPP